MAQPFRIEDYYTGLELLLMSRAQHDIEYKSSAVWQTILQRKFPYPCQVLCEQAPDDSRRRCDMQILRYYSESHIAIPILYVEVKRRGGSLKDVEEQGLDAGRRAIVEEGLTSIFILTAWGLRFRAWFVDKDDRALAPVFGTASKADRKEYLDLTTLEGIIELDKTIDLIRNEGPIRQAPVVPSQGAEMQEMLLTEAYYDQGPSGTYAYGGEMMDYDDVPSMGVEIFADLSLDVQAEVYQPEQNVSSAEEEHAGIGSPHTVQGGESSGKQKRRVRVEVEVKRTRHVLRKDKLEFRDVDNVLRTTTDDDWKRKERDGRSVYEHRGKRCIYWCNRLE